MEAGLPGPAGRAPSVCVAVLTFHRVDLLPRLLAALAAEVEDLRSTLPGARARVLVVDNDPDGSARDTVAAGSEADYVVETRQGISAARNRALAEASQDDLLAFIDDDETPRAGWLVALVRTQARYDAAAVGGPVVSVLDGPVEDFVVDGGFFDREHRAGLTTGTRVRRAATNNLLLDLRRVRSLGLAFDDRFGLTGGEDSVFTGHLDRAGGLLVWCAEAVVDDHLPAERLTRAYVLSRTTALSASGVRSELALCEGLGERTRLRARVAVRESARLAQGTLLVLLGRARRARGASRLDARGRRSVARGRGALAALVGRAPVVYGARPPRP